MQTPVIPLIVQYAFDSVATLGLVSRDWRASTETVIKDFLIESSKSPILQTQQFQVDDARRAIPDQRQYLAFVHSSNQSLRLLSCHQIDVILRGGLRRRIGKYGWWTRHGSSHPPLRNKHVTAIRQTPSS